MSGKVGLGTRRSITPTKEGPEISVMKTIRILSAAILLSTSTLAWATHEMPPPEEEGYDFESSNSSTAVGTGVGIGLGVGIGEGGNAQSSADAVATGGVAVAIGQGGQGGNQHQGQVTNVDAAARSNQEQRAAAVNEGNSNDTTFESHDRAFALGLSAATAAPVDSSICRVKQTAGWDVRIVARTGRNVFDADCLNTLLAQQTQAASFNRCMDIYAAYAKMSLLELAVRQLEQCGGVERAIAIAALRTKTTSEEHERTERVFQALQSK